MVTYSASKTVITSKDNWSNQFPLQVNIKISSNTQMNATLFKLPFFIYFSQLFNMYKEATPIKMMQIYLHLNRF